MKCQKCEELLSEYIDERLDAETAAEVAGHLAECRSCAESESKLRATIALVGGLERKPAPLDFGELAAAKLERRMLLDGEGCAAKRRIISPWRFTGIGVLAAAAVLVVCYVMIPPVGEKHTASYDRVDGGGLDKDFTGGDAVEREKAREIAAQPAVTKEAGKVTSGGEEKSEWAWRAGRVERGAAGSGGGGVTTDVPLAASGYAVAVPAPATRARTESEALGVQLFATEEGKATVTALAPEDAAKLKSLGYIGGDGEKGAAATSAPVAVAVDSNLMGRRQEEPIERADVEKALFFAESASAPVTIEFDGEVNAPVEKLISLLDDKGIKADVARESLDELSQTASDAGITVAETDADGARESLDELSQSAAAAGVTIVEIDADRAVVEFSARPDRVSEITTALKQAFTPVANVPADAKDAEGDIIDAPTTAYGLYYYADGLYDRAAGEEKALVVTRIVFVRRSAGAKEEKAP